MDAAKPELVDSLPACPACEGRLPTQKLFRKSGFWIEQCARCGHRFARPPDASRHVENTYGNDYFRGGGAGYSDYLSESQLLEAHGGRYGRILKQYAAPGRLLDVGAAAGFILKGLRSEGWDGIGVEPNDEMARYAREELGLDVTAQSFEEFDRAAPFDAISVIQVAAHFVDPRRAVAHLRDLLRPGGLCVVETWNVSSITARVLGKNWHEYSPPSVLHWWSRETLRRLFESLGFEFVASGRPAKWIEISHAKSLIGHKAREGSLIAKVASGALAVLPASLVMPYPAEDLFWAVYRKSAGLGRRTTEIGTQELLTP